MPREYTAEFNGVAVTAQQDLFEVAGPADAVVEITDIHFGQITEVGDAQEEELLILIKRGEGSVTSGAGGTTATARPDEKGDPAFGGVVEANNTTKMVTGAGTIVTLYSLPWNIRMPFDHYFTPEKMPRISPSDRITVELATTPADSITMLGTIGFREVGG